MTKRELARAISQAQSKGLAYATVDMAYSPRHVPALEVAGIIFEDYQRWLVWLTWDTSSDAEALASGEY